jgi:diguanylate cyclase (GGDEF)-like protein
VGLCPRRGLELQKTTLPEEQTRPDLARRRSQWKAYQGRITPSRLVFIDESWVKTTMAPLRGWEPRGRRLVGRVARPRILRDQLLWNERVFFEKARLCSRSIYEELEHLNYSDLVLVNHVIQTSPLAISGHSPMLSLPADLKRMFEGVGALASLVALRTSADHAPEALSERALTLRNSQLESALDNMSQGLCMFDSSAEIVVCNKAYLRLYSLSPAVVRPGCSLRRLIEHRRDVGLFRGDVDQYVASILAIVASRKIESHVGVTADGRSINIVNHPMPDGSWVVTHEDISERLRAEEKVAYMAHHDALTDLSNRAQLVSRIDYELARTRRSDEGFAVFMLDLDRFKEVNDSLGHPIGDLLLREVAGRLRERTRDSDTVARIGGDEFAILQTLTGQTMEEITALAERLLSSIGEPFEVNGHQISIGASIGIAIAPHDGNQAGELLRNADLALYRAKAGGRNTYTFFELAMDAEARSRHALEADLRKALTQGEFEVHYQTVINVETGANCGAEALIRWIHPDRGMIPPDRFVPLAEENGLIVPIGEWVLRTACMEAATWPPHLKLAVNLSPAQFKRGNLVATVRSALADSGLAPKRLELEITESVLLYQNASNLDVLRGLKDLGVSIVLDDFGTGFSSLSYLRMFPFDTIKIDRSFVGDMETRDDCAAIVSAVAGLSRTLGIKTTAEGVETPEQFALLRAAGCTLAQGFMFSRPCPAAALEFSPTRSQIRAAS